MSGKSSKTRQARRRAPAPTAEALRESRGRSSAAAKAAPATASARGTSPRQWTLLVAVVSVAALLVGTVSIALSLFSVASYIGGVPGASSAAVAPISTAPGDGTPATNPETAGVGNYREIGNPNARVVITEWFDYQCPACGRYALTREPDIERLYVETGKIRYVSRNFAFLGPESFLAAEAAEAAAAQGRYWDYRKLLFQRQQGENQGAFSADNLKRFAAELGLNQQAFNDALDKGTYRSAILAEEKEGESLGVNATPTFFINGRKIEGVPTVEGLGKLIDEELAKNP